jgi:hypothetical protein
MRTGNEHYSVAMPSELVPGAPLKNFKFRANSSHTTTPGMDSAASYELLSSLISLLKCTFATYANVEDLFSSEPAQQESMLQNKHIHRETAKSYILACTYPESGLLHVI